MPRNAPKKRELFTVSISIALKDRLRALSKSTGTKTSVLIDEAVMDLLAKYAEKGGIQLMSDGEARKTQHVIVVASGKGGVGKTTTTAALAYLFSVAGKKKVLLIDADAQINLTQIAQAKPDGKRDIQGAIITRTLNEKIPIETFIMPTQYKNIDIISGNPLIEKEAFLQKIRDAKLEDDVNLWVEMMNDIKALNEYDVILMDTHPSSGIAASYPMQACDYVIVPLDPNPSSVSGLKEVYKQIIKTRKVMNPNIKFLGCFFNKVKTNTSDAKQYIPTARDTIPNALAKVNNGVREGKVFNTVIRDSADVNKAGISRSAVTERFRNKDVGRDFYKLYMEVTEALA